MSNWVFVQDNIPVSIAAVDLEHRGRIVESDKHVPLKIHEQ